MNGLVRRTFNRKATSNNIGDGLNPYEQAITIIGKTLAIFDEDNLITCYGFGDASIHDQDVLSFYPEERFCNGFEDVLSRYKEIVPHSKLAGPTSFAPVIEQAMTIVEQSGGQYYVLLIIADGQRSQCSFLSSVDSLVINLFPSPIYAVKSCLYNQCSGVDVIPAYTTYKGKLFFQKSIVVLYADFINPIEALEIQRQPCATEEEEQMRNRYSIQSLLNVNPQHYQRVRFTTEATIIQVSAARGWCYKKWIACNMKVTGESSNLYCFRIIIDDGTATATVTCFSQAHTFVLECNEVVNAADNKDNRHLPEILKQLENKTYVFRYRFGKRARPEHPNFSLDVAFKPSAQPLLGLPAPQPATPPSQEILQQTSSNMPTETTKTNPCPFSEGSSHGLNTSSEAPKKTAKRVFAEKEGSNKKPRQE
ncbi:E3 ubiquitin protein ligase RGLG2-like protein [Tanacetum coccineum]|uniref:E3 ubiquitin protein ligase RGLG2-like protein n=1 Tax=Tanacetum coccineum TaxID=301880 RepID=A0ABQ5BZL6_9ASTR